MALAQLNPALRTSRRPARDLIEAVVDNMRKNLEPLRYSTLTPTRFTVYLHPAEYARLEGIIPVLEGQTVQALADELRALTAALRSPTGSSGSPEIIGRRSTMAARPGRSSSAPIPTGTWTRATC